MLLVEAYLQKEEVEQSRLTISLIPLPTSIF